MRFLLGVVIIALSVYGFYIGIARSNSPALFIKPQRFVAAEYECREASGPTFDLCLPAELDFEPTAEGLYFYSLEDEVRGSVVLLEALPGEDDWRRGLRGPILGTFMGGIDGTSSFDLMVTILSTRFNPVLMGPKASLLPEWIMQQKDGLIMIMEDRPVIVFSSPTRQYGVYLADFGVMAVSVEGFMDYRRLGAMLAGSMAAD